MHTVLPPDGDESISRDLPPSEIVQVLALRKARSACTQIACGLVLSADTIVYLDRQVLGKPSDEAVAFQMLQSLSGQTHEVYSSVAVVDVENGRHQVGYRRVEVSFRSLHDAEIRAYILSGEPMDKAGGYSIQGAGALFVDEIRGDYYAVVGLPLVLTFNLLKEFGGISTIG